MRVETKDGGDGVRCWNVAAIRSYADQINQKEARLTGANPDLLVMPGLVKCYGCEVMEYDYGIKCTASLTRTRYAIEGEIQPRPEDAAGSLGEIPGLETRAPDGVVPEPAAGATAYASESSSAKRSGLRGLFGRT
jgi:hypothetical protein